MKTFWVGPGGWTDTQHPDGTITFTSPTGLIYTTTPLGATFFPQLAVPTGTPPITTPPPENPRDLKGLRMPKRPRTRAQQHQRRITTERDANIAHRLANPPPF